MALIAVTGTIGAGKTESTGLLTTLLHGVSFDTDRCARELVSGDPEVSAAIQAEFGTSVFAEGRIDRRALREAVFADDTKRRALEGILHPRIRRAWTAWAAAHPHGAALVEIPLLYETGAAERFDYCLVVGCSRESQISRLMESRRLSPEVARQMADSQWPLSEKIKRADCVIWNDGSRAALERQIKLCACQIELLFGSAPEP